METECLLSLAGLAHAYASAGRTAEARGILQRLLQRAELKPVSSYDIAMIYLGLGERQRALEWLERALPERPSSFVFLFLFVEPRMDPRRAEARFQKLLAEIRASR